MRTLYVSDSAHCLCGALLNSYHETYFTATKLRQLAGRGGEADPRYSYSMMLRGPLGHKSETQQSSPELHEILCHFMAVVVSSAFRSLLTNGLL